MSTKCFSLGCALACLASFPGIREGAMVCFALLSIGCFLMAAAWAIREGK